MSDKYYVLVSICEDSFDIPSVHATHEEAFEKMAAELAKIVDVHIDDLKQAYAIQRFDNIGGCSLHKNSACSRHRMAFDWQIFELTDGKPIEFAFPQE